MPTLSPVSALSERRRAIRRRCRYRLGILSSVISAADATRVLSPSIVQDPGIVSPPAGSRYFDMEAVMPCMLFISRRRVSISPTDRVCPWPSFANRSPICMTQGASAPTSLVPQVELLHLPGSWGSSDSTSAGLGFFLQPSRFPRPTEPHRSSSECREHQQSVLVASCFLQVSVSVGQLPRVAPCVRSLWIFGLVFRRRRYCHVPGPLVLGQHILAVVLWFLEICLIHDSYLERSARRATKMPTTPKAITAR